MKEKLFKILLIPILVLAVGFGVYALWTDRVEIDAKLAISYPVEVVVLETQEEEIPEKEYSDGEKGVLSDLPAGEDVQKEAPAADMGGMPKEEISGEREGAISDSVLGQEGAISDPAAEQGGAISDPAAEREGGISDSATGQGGALSDPAIGQEGVNSEKEEPAAVSEDSHLAAPAAADFAAESGE